MISPTRRSLPRGNEEEPVVGALPVAEVGELVLEEIDFLGAGGFGEGDEVVEVLGGTGDAEFLELTIGAGDSDGVGEDFAQLGLVLVRVVLDGVENYAAKDNRSGAGDVEALTGVNKVAIDIGGILAAGERGELREGEGLAVAGFEEVLGLGGLVR